MKWKSKLQPKPIKVKVSTLESEMEFNIPHKSTGKYLFDLVCSSLGLRETWYFGLQCYSLNSQSKMNLLYWLDLEKKIISQRRSNSSDSLFFILFHPKFFPEDVDKELIQGITIHLFYLEIKEKILNKNIFDGTLKKLGPESLNKKIVILLTSYAAYADFGDIFYKTNQDNSQDESVILNKLLNILPVNLLSDENRSDLPELLSQVQVLAESHSNLSKSEAELEYLKLSQDLKLFGTNLFPITCLQIKGFQTKTLARYFTKKTVKQKSNNKHHGLAWLGISSIGVQLYEGFHSDKPIYHFSWSNIKNVSYREPKFSIKLNPLAWKKSSSGFISLSERNSFSMSPQQLAITNGEKLSPYLSRKLGPSSSEENPLWNTDSNIKEDEFRSDAAVVEMNRSRNTSSRDSQQSIMAQHAQNYSHQNLLKISSPITKRRMLVPSELVDDAKINESNNLSRRNLHQNTEIPNNGDRCFINGKNESQNLNLSHQNLYGTTDRRMNSIANSEIDQTSKVYPNNKKPNQTPTSMRRKPRSEVKTKSSHNSHSVSPSNRLHCVLTSSQKNGNLNSLFQISQPNFLQVDVWLADTKNIKTVMSFCAGNHALFMRRRQPDTVEVQQMKTQAREEKTQRELERQRFERTKAEKAEALEAKQRLENKCAKLEKALKSFRILHNVPPLPNQPGSKNSSKLAKETPEERFDLETSDDILGDENLLRMCPDPSPLFTEGSMENKKSTSLQKSEQSQNSISNCKNSQDNSYKDNRYHQVYLSANNNYSQSNEFTPANMANLCPMNSPLVESKRGYMNIISPQLTRKYLNQPDPMRKYFQNQFNDLPDQNLFYNADNEQKVFPNNPNLQIIGSYDPQMHSRYDNNFSHHVNTGNFRIGSNNLPRTPGYVLSNAGSCYPMDQQSSPITATMNGGGRLVPGYSYPGHLSTIIDTPLEQSLIGEQLMYKSKYDNNHSDNAVNDEEKIQNDLDIMNRGSISPKPTQRIHVEDPNKQFDDKNLSNPKSMSQNKPLTKSQRKHNHAYVNSNSINYLKQIEKEKDLQKQLIHMPKEEILYHDDIQDYNGVMEKSIFGQSLQNLPYHLARNNSDMNENLEFSIKIPPKSALPSRKFQKTTANTPTHGRQRSRTVNVLQSDLNSANVQSLSEELRAEQKRCAQLQAAFTSQLMDTREYLLKTRKKYHSQSGHSEKSLNVNNQDPFPYMPAVQQASNVQHQQQLIDNFYNYQKTYPHMVMDQGQPWIYEAEKPNYDIRGYNQMYHKNMPIMKGDQKYLMNQYMLDNSYRCPPIVHSQQDLIFPPQNQMMANNLYQMPSPYFGNRPVNWNNQANFYVPRTPNDMSRHVMSNKFISIDSMLPN